ncbi:MULTISPECIES: hypothetical protein [Robiginitalea]|uniref:3-methyl-2-oxobutanoate hydroxymethyltransferase n=1 Tax=Robiginitalea biformata (strain ATCC BAA-864 / DSM 15991 / KCTC 12146 / HTCC2501) TaxID=313596 RepID=A4CLQ3_ROBBH|nr:MULTISPECIES: hypothetical protein [Robiginitalea]EAR15802.1 hypothetical protein RB2501_15779 [Robiginitalea biformata HTCC2501]MDC6354226.1 nuclear transport factor 2 family protein [Robiginitalea sp. PM2]MDC6374493.1 nuclear transport factor 2 family protein [Robiginitalea sp. SP8]
MYALFYRLLAVFILLSGPIGLAQQDSKAAVRSSIDRFFQGLHQRDTTGMKTVLGAEVLLQTVGSDPEGKAVLRSQPMADFLASIAGIPDTVVIEERLLDYKIRVDGNMAHAWTPYEFYVGGKFSHCGVNSFQLFRDGSDWKIIYIVDTRRRDGCL